MKSKGLRVDNELDSIWIFYFDNGLEKERVTYACSVKEGWTEKFSNQGFITTKLSYVNDTLAGPCFVYFEDFNAVQFEYVYTHGYYHALPINMPEMVVLLP